MSKAVAKADVVQMPAAVPPQAEASLMAILDRFLGDPSVPIERVNQAFDFYERVQADRAKRAFLEAKAAFKAVAPEIAKDKKNLQYNSSYATIGNVVNTTNEALSAHGLDASWDFEQGDRIKVTCKLRHVLGHSETVSLSGLPDTSGAKNPLQQIKSTLTYLKLATFEAVTGIATKEGNLDDDGKAAGGGDGLITPEQAEELSKLITETNSDIHKFLAMGGVESLSDIPARQFVAARAKLLMKLRRGANDGATSKTNG